MPEIITTPKEATNFNQNHSDELASSLCGSMFNRYQIQIKAAPKHIHFLQGDLKKYIVTMNTMKAQTSNARSSGYDRVYMIVYWLSFEYAKVQKRNDKGNYYG